MSRKKNLLDYLALTLFIMCMGLALSASLEYVRARRRREYLGTGNLGAEYGGAVAPCAAAGADFAQVRAEDAAASQKHRDDCVRRGAGGCWRVSAPMGDLEYPR